MRKEALMGFGRRRIALLAAKTGAAIIAAFVFLAYFLLPFLWTHFEHEPALADISMRTETAQHIAGDPLNAGLVGSKDEVIAAFQQIGWLAADSLSLKNDLAIAGSVVLDRAYDTAPVSRLFFQDRQQDLAFEKPVGDSPEQRRHIRLWKVLEQGLEQRPVWLGAVSFDKDVGLSHFTGQITHHIDADVDAQRDALVKELTGARIVTRLYQVSGIGPTISGRNGEGDRFFTDGELTVAVLRAGAARGEISPEVLENPPLIRLKQTIWSAFSGGQGR
jgi:LssY C-terminus